ncbi:DNA cytosine methyltransferase [Microvirga yunnanensis]|uniref:DNA cytosine methyltransferase n=1 Tax=Microvirga yunnanensis TaxID=2953740 RepID=UPI0021CA6341|nr:DNA cytosine methyltransferase [Microvirga sp. HBU65207]
MSGNNPAYSRYAANAAALALLAEETSNYADIDNHMSDLSANNDNDLAGTGTQKPQFDNHKHQQSALDALVGGLILDSFAGGGGASTGIAMALGRQPDVAINHDGEALSMHEANHPETIHVRHDIWRVDPRKYTNGRPVGLGWFSPDCRSHSRAAGGKPKAKNIRDLAWVVVRWAKVVRPKVILLENVEEFAEWGPLTPEGMPCPKRKGQTFAEWVSKLERLGYRVEKKELRACDFGDPTIRKRLFMVARCDGKPIVWPVPTHGDPKSADVQSGKLLPWRTAAEIIDWERPCPSIFMSKSEALRFKAETGIQTKRPLERATLARIAKGVRRYVIDAKEPFLVSLTHQGGDRSESISDPIRTITAANRGEKALVQPFMTKFRQGAVGSAANDPLPTVTANSFEKRPGCGVPMGLVAPVMTYAQQGGLNRSPQKPLHTITASRKDQNAVIAPYLVPRYGERAGQEPRTYPIDRPTPTIVPDANGGSLAAVSMIRHFGASIGSAADEPVGAATAGGGGKTGMVATFLAQNNTGVIGHSADEPLSTIVGKGCTQSVVAAHLTKFQENSIGQMPDEPIHTVMAGAPRHGVVETHMVTAPHVINMKGSDMRSSTATDPMPTATAQGNHIGTVGASLVAYYGSDQDTPVSDPIHTITTRDRFGLADVKGGLPPLAPELLEKARKVADFLREFGCWDDREIVTVGAYVVVDIGLRMLTPRELARGQGFPDDYILEAVHDGKPLTRTSQTRMIGNSVCPGVAKALVHANVVVASMIKEPPPVYRAWGAQLKARLQAREQQASIEQMSLFGEAA